MCLVLRASAEHSALEVDVTQCNVRQNEVLLFVLLCVFIPHRTQYLVLAEFLNKFACMFYSCSSSLLKLD